MRPWTATDVAEAALVGGHWITATAEGGLFVYPPPGPTLAAELAAHKAGLLALCRGLGRPLRPLTDEENRLIRTPGSALPPGVAYGQGATGKWRRLM